jgi:hypothetical protein
MLRRRAAWAGGCDPGTALLDVLRHGFREAIVIRFMVATGNGSQFGSPFHIGTGNRMVSCQFAVAAWFAPLQIAAMGLL